MKFDVIVADPPWFFFFDKLKMQNLDRGAESKYSGILKDDEIINLDVKSLAKDNSILVLWVPSSFLQVGLDAMKSWGFKQKQTWIWVKTKKDPFGLLKKKIRKLYKSNASISDIEKEIDEFNLNDCLNFFMGHMFRQTHEVCIIGTRGKWSQLVKNKSQRSVDISAALEEHSKKPEELQDRLDKIFVNAQDKLELFARRDRPGWTCVGNQNQSTYNEDIRDSISRLKLI